MIWVIANKKEEDGSFPTYRHYKQAFPEREIDICLATPQDNFAFIHRGDKAIVRTRDPRINARLREAQMAYCFESTVESYMVDWLTHDKEAIKVILAQHGIAFPKTVQLSDVTYGKYFVKARYGENSIGVDEKSVCRNRKEVIAKCVALLKKGIEPMVEEYIEGEDLTTSLIYSSTDHKLRSYSSTIHANTNFGFHSFDSKLEFAFTAELYYNEILDRAARKVFNAIGAQHLLRIDSRMVDGVPYILDVNMLPGLGPIGHMCKCMEVNGVDYHTFIRMMVNSAW